MSDDAHPRPTIRTFKAYIHTKTIASSGAGIIRTMSDLNLNGGSVSESELAETTSMSSLEVLAAKFE